MSQKNLPIDQWQSEQDLLALALVNHRSQKGEIYFLIGSIALYLQSLKAHSNEYADSISSLLTKQYTECGGLTFQGILKEYCGETDPHTRQCQDLLNTLNSDLTTVAAHSP